MLSIYNGQIFELCWVLIARCVPQILVCVRYHDWLNINGEHLYSAFSTKLKALDTHYFPDRPGINLKPSQLPGKYTVRLPVRCSKTSNLIISCSVWYRVADCICGKALSKCSPLSLTSLGITAATLGDFFALSSNVLLVSRLFCYYDSCLYCISVPSIFPTFSQIYRGHQGFSNLGSFFSKWIIFIICNSIVFI